jgi:uncharacterized protein (DUF433 family)
VNLNDYFDFLSADDIRIRGHRIGIEDILYYYLEGYSPEEIGAQFPSLTQEHIFATITYYLRNRPELDAYLARQAARQEENYHAWTAQESALIDRLRDLQARRRQKRLAA